MTIFDEVKSIANVLREADKVPQYQQILGVLEKLLEMQNRISTLEVENKELKEKLKTKESLFLSDNIYWGKEDIQKKRPICKICYENEGKTITLDIGRFGFGSSNNLNHYQYKCLVCKNYFK